MNKFILSILSLSTLLLFSACSSDKYEDRDIKGHWITIERELRTNYKTKDNEFNKYFSKFNYERTFGETEVENSIFKQIGSGKVKENGEEIYGSMREYALEGDSIRINNWTNAYFKIENDMLHTREKVGSFYIGEYLQQIGAAPSKSVPEDMEGYIYTKEIRKKLSK